MVDILIIEDDNQMRTLLREAFLMAGLEVETASGGSEADQILAKRTFAVVITDIVMPDKDGFEVIFDLRKQHPETAIIAISGGGRLNATNYLESAKTFGCRAVFEKPVPLKALIAQVKEILAEKTQ